jgi:hypothetical protein
MPRVAKFGPAGNNVMSSTGIVLVVAEIGAVSFVNLDSHAGYIV